MSKTPHYICSSSLHERSSFISEFPNALAASTNVKCDKFEYFKGVKQEHWTKRWSNCCIRELLKCLKFSTDLLFSTFQRNAKHDTKCKPHRFVLQAVFKLHFILIETKNHFTHHASDDRVWGVLFVVKWMNGFIKWKIRKLTYNFCTYCCTHQCQIGDKPHSPSQTQPFVRQIKIDNTAPTLSRYARGNGNFHWNYIRAEEPHGSNSSAPFSTAAHAVRR